MSGRAPPSGIKSSLVKAMKRTKIFVLLLIAVLIHFGLTFAVVVGRLSCDVQVHCISRLNEVAGAVLSFPLGLVVWVMQYVGLDPDVVTGAIWGGDIFVLCVVNSILAVIIVWYALIKPITRRRKKVRQ
jgi:predicted neutral ceramidase superfamily lipid hydrolase